MEFLDWNPCGALGRHKVMPPLCIPQTEGGGPEINREGDRGGDLARWNRFIASIKQFINHSSVTDFDLQLMAGGCTEMIYAEVDIPNRDFRFFFHHELNYSYCLVLKSNPASISLQYSVI